MKVKPSPTSPKNKAKSDVEKLYADKSLKTIVQPASRRSNVAFILFTFIVGIIGGAMGVIGLDYYQDRTGETFFFTQEGSTTNVRQPSARKETSRQAAIQRTIETIQPSLISVFEKRDPAQIFTDQLYVDADRLGAGIVITSDGWMVIHNSAIADLGKTYVAVTDDRRIYEINAILRDPMTDFYFAKVKASGLTAVEFEMDEEIVVGDEVVIAEPNAPYYPSYIIATLRDTHHRNHQQSTDVIESSEEFTKDYRIVEPTRLIPGSVVVSFDGNIIGLVESTDSDVRPRILPGDHIRTALPSLLKNNVIQRNVLGVLTVDLSTTLNVPTSLSQANSRGAVIVNRTDGTLGVFEDSPAERAGLHAGDIILKIGSTEMSQVHTVADVIQLFESGSTVDVDILTGSGEQKTVSVTFDITE